MFFRIFTVAFGRLGYLRVNDCPAGARKRIKASVKKRRNTAPGFNTLDPIYFLRKVGKLATTKNVGITLPPWLRITKKYI